MCMFLNTLLRLSSLAAEPRVGQERCPAEVVKLVSELHNPESRHLYEAEAENTIVAWAVALHLATDASFLLPCSLLQVS